MLKSLVPAVVLSASVALLPGVVLPAAAMAPARLVTGGAAIVQVYDGCGIFAHRGPYGYCRHGGQAGGYIPFQSCPPGFHIGFGGRRCFLNR